MLLSNGLHHSENLPVKFGFSPQIVPANIVKKLPSQRCFKPLLIPIFNFPRKRPTLAFTGKVGTHSPFGKRSHTRAHTAKHGAFRMGVVSLPSDRSARSRIFPGRVSERRTLPLLGLGRVCSRRTKRACGTAMRLCASLFRGVAAPLGCVILSLVFQHCVLLLSMWNSHTTQTDWYHHSRLVLHAVEPPTSGHQNGPLVVCCSVGKFFIDFSSV